MNQIELLLVSSLIPYARNSRTHSEEQVIQIAASIREFGFTNPVLIDSNGTIIAGHGRVMAAKKVGLAEVPCLRLQHLSPSQIRAYVIADNKLALNAGWDDEMLKAELLTLQEEGFNTDLTGFSDDELNALLNSEIIEGQTDPDEVPEPPVDPITKLGDIWILGNHRLMCGDSTSVDAVQKMMDGSKADMVFTDPPYGMFLDTDFTSMDGLSPRGKSFLGTKGGKKYDKVAGDNNDFTPELINTIFASHPDCHEVFLWGADYYSELIPDRNNGSWIVWDKRTNDGSSELQASSADRLFGSNFELCWSKAKHKRELARIRNGIFGVKNEAGNSKTVHPTQKPVQLAEWFFEKWGNPNDNVVDHFGGSGSTLIACEKTGRKARLMELVPKYCDVIVKRWEDFTGKKARLEKRDADE
jgi:DNA modification methylase